MKQYEYRIGAIICAIVLLFMSSIASMAIEPSLLEQEEVVVRSGIPTEDGPMTFVANEGLFSTEGSNYTKIFAKRLFGTTLWSHERRLKCYEHVIRVCAQLASVNTQAVAEHRAERILDRVGGGLESTEALTAFRLLNTNYVPVEYPLDRIRNDLSHVLRTLSPQSRDGIVFRTTNLERVSQALTMIDWGVTLAGYAYGAAMEHALASDAALERIDELRAVLGRAPGTGVEIDEIWYETLDQAAANLTRDETYYGALMGTLLDHRDELIGKGMATMYPALMAHFHHHIQHYVAGWLTKHTAWGAAKIGAHASHFGAIWTWSLLTTYYTIDGLLDQHERAQASVAASTLDYLLHEGYEGEALSVHTEPMVLQAQVTYFDKMEQTSSGFLTGFYDLVSGILGRDQHYGAAQEHFRRLKTEKEHTLRVIFSVSTQDNDETAANSYRTEDCIPSFLVHLDRPFEIREDKAHARKCGEKCIQLTLRGPTRSAGSATLTDNSSRFYEVAIETHGAEVFRCSLYIISIDEVATVDVDCDGSDELFVRGYDGGTGISSTHLHLLHPSERELLSLELIFVRDLAQPIPGVTRSANFGDENLEHGRDFLEKIKYDYGYIDEKEANRRTDEPRFAAYQWARDNYDVTDGTMRVKRYKGDNFRDMSSVTDRIVEENMIYRAHFRGSVIAYDRNADEFFIVYHPYDTYNWPTVLKKVGPYLFIGTRGEGVAAVNVETLHLKRYKSDSHFGDVDRIEVRDSTVVVDDVWEIPFPDF